ncbi:hypothetical protein ACFSCX_18620 [Bacillus salitolerans]|uniref:Uncharacterized protein n=1 Tax=Bacillus salitolerans TaxID=1437434 RepID=A0ABW4LTV5_9BACI
MTYVIDRANVKKERDIVQCSFTIKNNKIDYIARQMNRVDFFKMDVSEYLLTPGHVMLDFQIEELNNFLTLKNYMKEKLISKGCTTVLFTITIDYEAQLLSKLKKAKHRMINSPIDYSIGIKIPIRALTPSLIRQCKRYKIPVIFVSLSEQDLGRVAWGWIRDALYPYYPCIVPIWREDFTKNKFKKVTEFWQELCLQEQIPTIPFVPSTGEPLPRNVLCRIGIYPLKGDIRIGGDVDYNLYPKKDVGFDNLGEVKYDMDKPIITVHKGRTIKVGDHFYINPGFGEQVVIKVPGYFASTFE